MIAILAGAGGALCVFLLSLMLAKPQRALGDAWLSAWLAIHFVYLAAFGLTQITSGAAVLTLSLAGQAAAALLAPTQFLHTWSITAGPAKAGLLHASWSLVILAIILALPIFLQVRVESGALVATASHAWVMLLPPAAILATLGYPAAALARLHTHRRRLKQRLSNLHKTDLAWARAWAISTIALLLTQFAVFAISLTGTLPVQIHVALLLAAQTLQVAFVGWHGLTRSRVFRVELADASRAAPRDLETAREDLALLRAFMQEQEPHRDSELTAGALAARLGWAPHRLTQALRLGGSTNFHDFVNRARVETVKIDALNPKLARASLLALAFDAGFGSKSAFYEAFRAIEGVAPARWRAQNVTR